LGFTDNGFIDSENDETFHFLFFFFRSSG